MKLLLVVTLSSTLLFSGTAIATKGDVVDACGPVRTVEVDPAAVLRVDVTARAADHLLVYTRGRVYLIREREFASKTLSRTDDNVFRFRLSELTGVRWTDAGWRIEEPIYTGTGIYEFYFADDIETEPENTVNCTIQLIVDERRSAKSRVLTPRGGSTDK